jgi:hypothetical protein
MSTNSSVATEAPDPLGLAVAGVLISACLGLAWPGFASVTATLAVLVFVALLLRWSDATPGLRPPGRLAFLAGAASFALVGGVLLTGEGRVALIASATVLGALLGCPGSLQRGASA